MMKVVKVPKDLVEAEEFLFTLSKNHVKMAVVVKYFEYSVAELRGVSSEIDEVMKAYKLEEF